MPNSSTSNRSAVRGQIAGKMTTAWLPRLRPNPQARLRLFCFPYAGGGAAVFHTWPRSLPSQVDVCPVQLPGREARLSEPPFTHITPLLQALASAVQPYLDMPFAFFGHSLGALISFELARWLRRQNQPGPLHLLVSGLRAPQAPNPEPPIYLLPDAEFIQKLRRLNGLPQAVLDDAELMQLMLPLLRADMTVYETYVYTAEAPLDCPISAFGGLQDRVATRDNMAAWRDQTSRAFTLRMLPGDHFFLHSAQALLLQALSHDLMPCLGQIAQR